MNVAGKLPVSGSGRVVGIGIGMTYGERTGGSAAKYPVQMNWTCTDFFLSVIIVEDV